MDKDLKKLLKDGAKNPNAYRKGVYNKKRFYIGIVVLIFILIFGIIEILKVNGVISWGKLYEDGSAVNGAVSSNSDFSVHYINTGQSDCSIVKCDGKVMMIDTAAPDGMDAIRASLITLDIDKIDVMLITHQHDDHMGCAEEIIKSYPVETIIMPRLSEINMVTTKAYENLLLAINDKGVKPVAAEPGYEFMLGSARVTVLAPLKQDKNLNNMSAVTRITYGDTAFLFEGDAEKEVEKELLNSGVDLSADVIKLGHHGSKTSSTEKYLKAVSPSVGIVSCGKENSYGHPHGEVLERLDKLGIDVYITALQGSITAESDGKTVKIITEKNGEEKTYG